MKTLLAVWLAGAALCAAQAPARKNPFAGDARAAEEGRIMFRGSCGLCHGIRGEGGRGPDLTLGSYSVGDSDAALFNIIAYGSTGTEMPEFGARFEDENIWRLVTYIRSLARRDVVRLTGNRAAGEKLFWEKGQCGQCHVVGGRGGRMGPDLSLAGRQRSLAYLKDSIVNPNADITAGYPTVTVVTRDGKKIVGTQRGIDNFSVQLMDAGENYRSYLRDAVASVKREFRSLMPDTYRSLFSEAEMNDLLVYLMSLRGAEAKR